MIDKIVLRKNKLSKAELKQLLKKSKLRTHYKNSLIHYDNKDTKDFNGGFFIQIDTKGSLKVTGSVHKFNSFLKVGRLENWDNITMKQSKETILKIFEYYGLGSLYGFEVKSVEIGANFETLISSSDILQKVDRIGNKKFYFHPRFKKESHKTTETHNDFRRVFRIYDKLHEIKDKGGKLPPNTENLIRCEQIYRRQYKLILSEFLSLENLTKFETDFYKELEKIKLIPFVEYVGTGIQSSIKKEVAKSVMIHGTKKALKLIKERHEKKELTPKQYRLQREFIRDWHEKEYYKDFILKE